MYLTNDGADTGLSGLGKFRLKNIHKKFNPIAMLKNNKIGPLAIARKIHRIGPAELLRKKLMSGKKGKKGSKNRVGAPMAVTAAEVSNMSVQGGYGPPNGAYGTSIVNDDNHVPASINQEPGQSPLVYNASVTSGGGGGGGSAADNGEPGDASDQPDQATPSTMSPLLLLGAAGLAAFFLFKKGR